MSQLLDTLSKINLNKPKKEKEQLPSFDGERSHEKSREAKPYNCSFRYKEDIKKRIEAYEASLEPGTSFVLNRLLLSLLDDFLKKKNL